MIRMNFTAQNIHDAGVRVGTYAALASDLSENDREQALCIARAGAYIMNDTLRRLDRGGLVGDFDGVSRMAVAILERGMRELQAEGKR